MTKVLGPQGEPLLTDEELRALPDPAVASGTDRAEYATTKKPLVGPQGELIYPSLDSLCPTCGQPFPEPCSHPNDEEIDDPDDEPADDREDITELSA